MLRRSPDRGFTHVDPFEDTERSPATAPVPNQPQVSPTSIRSRILKGSNPGATASLLASFTHVDPFEDTESWRDDALEESRPQVSPTSIRSRILKARP